jgi:hypothetical protein
MAAKCELPRFLHRVRVDGAFEPQADLEDERVILPIVEPHQLFEGRQVPAAVDERPGRVKGEKLTNS